MLSTKKQMKTKQQTKQTKQTKKTTEISLGLCLPSWIKLKLWDEFQPC